MVRTSPLSLSSPLAASDPALGYLPRPDLGPRGEPGHLTPTPQPSAPARPPATSAKTCSKARGRCLGSHQPSPRSWELPSQQEPVAPVTTIRAGRAQVLGTLASVFPARPPAGSAAHSVSPTPRPTSPTQLPEPGFPGTPQSSSLGPQLAWVPTTTIWGHSRRRSPNPESSLRQCPA